MALVGTFIGVVVIGYGMPGKGDKQTNELDQLNNSWLDGVSAENKYLIGVVSMMGTAVCMSTVYISTRLMKSVHYSLI
jgi:hypothetical protein